MTAQNNTPKTAVLICNTGSPAAPTKEAVAKYLAEFLGDRRVVEMNPLIWQPILRGIIIPRRAQASADRYKTVWTQKGSPLVAATSDTAQGLQKVLGDEFIVSWAMCYGVQRIEPAFERRPVEEAVLMFCKHCLRYSMGWCPVHQKGRSPYQEPYYLVSSDGRRFRLDFDCRQCQMKVSYARE